MKREEREKNAEGLLWLLILSHARLINRQWQSSAKVSKYTCECHRHVLPKQKWLMCQEQRPVWAWCCDKFLFVFFFRLRDQCDSRIYTWGKNGMNHRVFLNRKGCYIAMQFRKDSAEKLLQFHFAMEFDNWWQLQQLFTDDIYPNLSTDDNWWIAWARSKLCVCDTEVACPERRWAMGRPVAMGSEINEGRRPNPWLCWSKVWGIFSNLLDLLDILLTPAGFHLW